MFKTNKLFIYIDHIYDKITLEPPTSWKIVK